MKFLKFILLIVALIILFLHSKAQSKEETLRYRESILAMKKKALVLNYLQLTEAEKSAFWPIYNRYNSDILDYEMEYFQLVANYAEKINTSSARGILDVSDRILQNELELARLRKQYYRKFKKALSPIKASEFMQLDQTFRMTVRLELQNQPHQPETLHTRLFPESN